MKIFYVGSNEVAEVELVSTGLPVSQASAELFVKRLIKLKKKSSRARSRSCYGPLK